MKCIITLVLDSMMIESTLIKQIGIIIIK